MDAVTAVIIQDMITAGRIVEAKALLTMGETSLNSEELRSYNLEIEQRQTKAETLIAQAEAMERAGKNEEAKALYESVVLFAADFPSIQEHIKRTDEALFLTRAVKRRSQRLRGSLPPKAGSAKKRTLALLGATLTVALATAALFLVQEKPQPQLVSLPEKTALKTPALVASQQAAIAPAVPAPASTPTETPPEREPITPDSPPEATPQPVIPQAAPMSKPVSAPPAFAGPETPPEEKQTMPPSSELPQSTPAVPLPSPEPLTTTGTHHSLPKQTKQKATVLYTVQPGDSLSLIALRQLCHEDAWKRIYQLNREQIADPQKLLPGQVLRLTGVESRCAVTP